MLAGKWDGEGDDFTVQQHTRDVASFIAALEAGPVHLLGHSRGGHIAFRAAENYPDLIRSLVLVEPGGVLAADLEADLGPSPPAIALGPLYAKAAERIRRGEIDEGLRTTIDMIAGPGGWERTPEYGRQMLRDNAATLLGQIKEQRAPFARADAEAIKAPTLLIAGERSPASFHHILDGLERAMRDAWRVVIPNASHASNIDNPRLSNARFWRFLKDGDGWSTRSIPTGPATALTPPLQHLDRARDARNHDDFVMQIDVPTEK